MRKLLSILLLIAIFDVSTAQETYLRVNSEVETAQGLKADSFRAEIKPDFSNVQKDSTIYFAFTFKVAEEYRPFKVRINGAVQSAGNIQHKVADPTQLSFSNYFGYAQKALENEYGWDVDIITE